MKKSIAASITAALALSVAIPCQAWGDESAPVAEHASAAQLRSYVAVTKEGLVAHAAVADPLANTLVVRRDASGEVERHARMNDVMIAQAGEVSIILGGRIEGGHETTPGEWRGGTIIGGRAQTLRPGDVLWIPAGIPHQMVLRPRHSFTYLVVKTERR